MRAAGRAGSISVPVRPLEGPVGWRSTVLDLVYIAAILAVFGVVALFARGVGKL